MDKKQVWIWAMLPVFLAAIVGVDVLLGTAVPPAGMLLMCLTGLSVYLLLALRRQVADRAELGYMIVALCAGAFLALGMPGGEVGFCPHQVYPAMVTPWMVRAGNLLIYIALTSLGLSCMKRFKLTMACVALIPALMEGATLYTATALTSGLGLLGVALAVDAMLDRRTLLTRKRAICTLVCLLIGAAANAAYVPLILLAALMPRSKFESRAAGWWFRSMTVIICLAGLAAGMYMENGALAMPAELGSQVKHFAAEMAEHFTGWFVTDVRFDLARLPDVTGTLMLGILGLTFFTVITDNDTATGQKLNWKLRLGLGAVALIAACVAYCTASAPSPSLMLPILPLTLIILSPDGIVQRMNKTGWHFAFFALHSLLLGAVMWSSILLNM